MRARRSRRPNRTRFTSVRMNRASSWRIPFHGATTLRNDPLRTEVHTDFGQCNPIRPVRHHTIEGRSTKRMRLISLGIALAVAGIGLADTVTLRNGGVVKGTYLGGTARQVRIDSGDQIRTVDVDDISKIEFTAPAATSAPPPAPAPAPAAAAAPAPAPLQARPSIVTGNAAPTASPSGVELPAGTNIVIRMIDGVDSE